MLLLGGSMGVAERRQYPDLQWTIEWLATAVAAGRPILAICLGGQLLAHSQGGQVYRQQHQERGISAIELIALGCNDPLFAGLDPPFASFGTHNDSFELPPGAQHLGRTDICSGQAFRVNNAWRFFAAGRQSMRGIRVGWRKILSLRRAAGVKPLFPAAKEYCQPEQSAVERQPGESFSMALCRAES